MSNIANIMSITTIDVVVKKQNFIENFIIIRFVAYDRVLHRTDCRTKICRLVSLVIFHDIAGFVHQ